MKILNFGAGAVGLGIDSCLIKSGQEVDVVARKQTAELLNKEGLKRSGIFGDFTALPGSFRAFDSLSSISKADHDFIIVSVKSYDSREAAEALAVSRLFIKRKTNLVLFQNGCFNS